MLPAEYSVPCVKIQRSVVIHISKFSRALRAERATHIEASLSISRAVRLPDNIKCSDRRRSLCLNGCTRVKVDRGIVLPALPHQILETLNLTMRCLEQHNQCHHEGDYEPCPPR